MGAGVLLQLPFVRPAMDGIDVFAVQRARDVRVFTVLLDVLENFANNISVHDR